jgi:ABC-type uncharacterized transport system permease subunit
MSTWSEKFLAKVRRYGFKDVLLGKVKVPKTDEDYANACCKLGVRCSSTCDWMTNNLVLGFIISMAAMGSLFFFLRALFLEDRANPQLIQSAGFLDNFLSPDDASLRTLSRFLMSLAVELFLTWFAMYFLFVTVIFSGILGCCRIPFLGGRPYEIYASQLPK